jgi:hypothetical protein
MKTEEDEAFDELARKQGSWGGGFPAKRAMAADKLHWSDCAVHNAPAYPAGKCDCGVAQEPARKALKLALEVMQINLTLLEKIDPYKGQEDLLSDSLDMTHEAIASIEAALAQPAQEPVAYVTGTSFGRFIVEPLNPAMVLPVGMALYSSPQGNT